MKSKKIELGITSFGETTPLEATGKAISHAERIQNMVEEMELADAVGLDIYAIGEHHRSDFAVSVPEMVLAAGAVNTKNIRLSSAVTVLSSSDPIRIYQNFATLDAISNGRAEIMVGKGSFIESFPLFGYSLDDYYGLFHEKLDMLLEISEKELLTWEGRLTHSVDGRGVYPRAVQEKLPIWVATGGSPETAVRTAKMGLPIAFAIIGGEPRAFKQLIDAYRQIGKQWGHTAEQLQVASHSWGFIAEDNQQAVDMYFYPTKQVVDAISKDRPHWQPLTKEQYLNSVGEYGAMFVGDPQVVTEKIIKTIETLQLDRFMLHMPIGSLPHQAVLRAIELFGKEVAPKVRAYFEGR
ncbi:LLM class flavin-dependent oxidoreductase [Capnocytophaga canimorsus]|uniref:LLM class flavin-dependent oxidoreductase n=1 Tax=Capnocytophaga canimorsus TaxID=28188 RepID=A0AAC9Z537_9FLAO|nr:LLM class flavin-dependent oxidoreductase [Capnocytophaga canimorsus]ATA94411.1 LLM class flavin-dependent oxidoreductase [Capnocytophaga canimorsus]